MLSTVDDPTDSISRERCSGEKAAKVGTRHAEECEACEKNPHGLSASCIDPIEVESGSQ